MSSADSAPGFNHSIACMVAAVGVGHVVAARYDGRAAWPAICRRRVLHFQICPISNEIMMIVAMNLTWSLLGLLTCALTPLEWNLGSATLLMSSMDHAAFSALLWGRLGTVN